MRLTFKNYLIFLGFVALILLSVSLVTIGSRYAVSQEHQDYKILQVIDGDTVQIAAPFLPYPLKKTLLVRIQGIDTPEKGFRAHCPLENKRSLSAKSFTETKIKEGKQVKVVLIDWDKYGGRVLGDIVIDGKLLSKMLVENGFAVQYFGAKKVKDWCR